MQKEIAILGAGNLARCLLTGLIANGYSPEHLRVSNPSLEKLERFKMDFGIRTSQDNKEIVQGADLVIFAVKPALVLMVAAEIKTCLSPDTICLSLAAGLRLPTLERALGSRALVRAMPNVAAELNAAATGLIANTQLLEEDKSLIESIMRSIGMVIWCDDETQMDMVTALSGSGSAYVFYFIQALVDGGKALGLSSEIAHLLSVQTVLGAAELALKTPLDLQFLVDSVTSPQGTTEKALAVLKEGHFQEIIKKAILAAYLRAKELGDDFDKLGL